LVIAGLVLFSLVVFAPGARADPVDLYLYGMNPDGWGRYPANLTRPGPYLTYTNGTQLRLTLHSLDGSDHQFFIDYNNNSVLNTGEPRSGIFSNPGGTTSPPMTLDREGNFTYRCRFHPSTMMGKINIVAAGGGPGLGSGITFDWNLLIFAGIMVAITITALVALRRVWHSKSSEDEEIDSTRGKFPRTPR
jgi:hypothetical protein